MVIRTDSTICWRKEDSEPEQPLVAAFAPVRIDYEILENEAETCYTHVVGSNLPQRAINSLSQPFTSSLEQCYGNRGKTEIE